MDNKSFLLNDATKSYVLRVVFRLSRYSVLLWRLDAQTCSVVELRCIMEIGYTLFRKPWKNPVGQKVYKQK